MPKHYHSGPHKERAQPAETTFAVKDLSRPRSRVGVSYGNTPLAHAAPSPRRVLCVLAGRRFVDVHRRGGLFPAKPPHDRSRGAVILGQPPEPEGTPFITNCPPSRARRPPHEGPARRRASRQDVLMISISIDPSHDTPQLARYVRERGEAWLAVPHGQPGDIDRSRRRLASTDDTDDPAQTVRHRYNVDVDLRQRTAGQGRMTNVMTPPER